MCEHVGRKGRARHSYLREGRYPLRQLGLDLRQRLGLPHRLLQLLLGELQPLLQLPVLLLHLQTTSHHRQGKSVQSFTRCPFKSATRRASTCWAFNVKDQWWF